MTSSYELKLNIPAINAASERAFTETAFLLGRAFTEVITEPRTWEAFSDTRDIVDTGQLRSSQQLVFTKPLGAVFSWPVEYAAEVHEGLTLRNGQTIKGRPWTQVALQEFNVEATFLSLYQKYLSE